MPGPQEGKGAPDAPKMENLGQQAGDLLAAAEQSATGEAQMANENLQSSIQFAEEEAKKIVQAAEDEAKKIIQAAEDEAKKIIQAAKDSAQKIAKNVKGGMKEIETAGITLVKAIVAEGRSIFHAGKQHGPGTVLELTREDAAELKAKGFIADPNAAPVPTGNGPTFTPASGPTVTKA